MKALRFITGLAAAHFIVSFGAFWHLFGSGLGQFERGQMPSALDKFIEGVVDVLWFPFMQVCAVLHVRGGVEWLLFGLNSLLWGCVLYFAIGGCRRLLQSQTHFHDPVR